MKGITPIISIIILLLITISLAGVAYLYLSGWLTGITGKSLTVPTGGVFCASNSITATVTNTGSSSNLVTADFIVARIDNTPVPSASMAAINLAPGAGGILFTTASSAGPHKVYIGTSSHTESIPVNC